MPPPICGHIGSRSRRSFLKRSLAAGGAGTGMSLFTEPGAALAPPEDDKKLTRGDAALLQFAAAVEILESDLWIQYKELGGVSDPEVPGGTGNPIYYLEAGESRYRPSDLHP